MYKFFVKLTSFLVISRAYKAKVIAGTEDYIVVALVQF